MQLGDNGSLGNLFGYQVRRIELGGGVKIICKYLFRNLINLEYVYLPDGVETIEEYAFENCTKLTYVRIPRTVYIIHVHAFDGCTGFADVLYNENNTILVYCNPKLKLQTYRIPDGVTRICDGAFWGCDALETITLPSSVVTVGENAFYGCVNIIVIYVNNIVPPTATSASFTTLPVSVVKLKVPAEAVDSYRLAEGWKIFVNIEANEEEEDSNFDVALNELEAYVTAVATKIATLEQQYPNNTELTKTYKVQINTIQNTIRNMRDGIEATTQEAIDKLKADAVAINEAIDKITADIQKEFDAIKDLREKHTQLIAKFKEAVASLSVLDATAQAAAQAEIDKITNEINEVATNITNLESQIYYQLPGTWFNEKQTEIEAQIAAIETEIDDLVLVYTGMADMYTWLQKVKYVCQHYKVSDVSAVNAILTQTEQTFASCRNAETAATALSDAIDKLNAYLPEVWLLDLSKGNDLEAIYSNYAEYKSNGKYIIAVGKQEKAVNFRSFINVHADYKNVDLSSAELPGGFTFKGCLYVENVILPENDNSLTVGLLDNCPMLTTITSPYLVMVPNYTFEGVDKEKVMLYVPNGMKGAYQISTGWKEFTQIIEIGQDAVNKPGDQFNWGDGRYELAEDNYIKLIGFKGSRVVVPGVITINNVFYTVRYIGSGAFVDSEVTEVILPSTPGLIIEEGAFVRCYNLTSITIVKNVTIIKLRAFENCYNLKTVYVESEDLLGGDYNFDEIFGEQVEYVYINCYVKRLTSRIFRNTHIKYVYLFDDIEELDDEVFSECRWLISVKLPKNLRYIGKWAFLNCENLTEITIPEGVKEFGEEPFKGCTSFIDVLYNEDNTILVYCNPQLKLQTYRIPDGVTRICDGAFWGCDALEAITLPSSMVIVGENAFYGCVNIIVIYVNSIVPPTATSASFTTLPVSVVKLKVPAEAVDSYRLAEGWKDFVNIVEITDDDDPDNPTFINDPSVDVTDGETTFYTLDGKPVVNPTHGLYIKKQRMTNGKTKYVKVKM